MTRTSLLPRGRPPRQAPGAGAGPCGASTNPARGRRPALVDSSTHAADPGGTLTLARILAPAFRALDALLVRAYRLHSLAAGGRGCGGHGLRYRLSRLGRSAALREMTLAPGALIVELHLCNERDPGATSRDGAARWATRMLVRYRRSCREIARRMRDEPELRAVQGVRGVTAIFGGASGHGGAGRLPVHLGFEVLPHPAPLGAFGLFFQRLYAWGLLAAYTPGSLPGRRLGELGFIEVWMTRDAFLARFAAVAEAR